MKTVAVFSTWIRQRLVLFGRGRLWGALRSMDNDFLSRAGFVPELVQQGPGDWPRRTGSQEDPENTELSTDGVSIDERGKPVPIDYIDQLNRIGVPEATSQDPLERRHKAA